MGDARRGEEKVQGKRGEEDRRGGREEVEVD